MTSNIFSLEERSVLCAYFGTSAALDSADIDVLISGLGIDSARCGGVLSPLAVAATRILMPGREAGEGASGTDRNVLMLPRHALTVFWTDQIVGSDDYSLVWVPGFRRFVVTATGNQRNYGYPQFAIGHFEPTSQLRDAVGKVLRGWWRSQAAAGRQRWQGCESSALVPEAHAAGWRELAWLQSAATPMRQAL